MTTQDNTQEILDSKALIGTLTLEVFSNYFLLHRLKDDIGLITQWGVGAWLLIQELVENGEQSEEKLASHQHISGAYNHKLLRALEHEGLVAINAESKSVSITKAGEQAYKKLHVAIASALPDWSELFTVDELSSALGVLAKLRKALMN